jgi:hypothetical protein
MARQLGAMFFNKKLPALGLKLHGVFSALRACELVVRDLNTGIVYDLETTLPHSKTEIRIFVVRWKRRIEPAKLSVERSSSQEKGPGAIIDDPFEIIDRPIRPISAPVSETRPIAPDNTPRLLKLPVRKKELCAYSPNICSRAKNLHCFDQRIGLQFSVVIEQKEKFAGGQLRCLICAGKKMAIRVGPYVTDPIHSREKSRSLIVRSVIHADDFKWNVEFQRQ